MENVALRLPGQPSLLAMLDSFLISRESLAISNLATRGTDKEAPACCHWYSCGSACRHWLEREFCEQRRAQGRCNVTELPPANSSARCLECFKWSVFCLYHPYHACQSYILNYWDQPGIVDAEWSEGLLIIAVENLGTKSLTTEKEVDLRLEIKYHRKVLRELRSFETRSKHLGGYGAPLDDDQVMMLTVTIIRTRMTASVALSKTVATTAIRRQNLRASGTQTATRRLILTRTRTALRRVKIPKIGAVI